jgi:hypothetical protein
MPRGFNTTAKAESIKGFNSIATLIELLIDPSDPTYLTNYGRDISHDSKTFQSGQGMLGISEVVENSNNGIETVSLSLSGIGATFVNLLLDYNYIDRSVKIHKVFLAEDGSVLGNSILVFDGRIDKPSIKHNIDSGTASISCSASSHWVDFHRVNGRMTNDAHQKTYFSGDECFLYAIDYEKEIKWGQE